MKKTWYFSIALALGISGLPSLAGAQFNAPYGNGALAPSGYAVNPSYAQPVAYPSHTRANAPAMGMPIQGAYIPGAQTQMQTAQLQAPQFPTQPYQAQAYQSQPVQAQTYQAQQFQGSTFLGVPQVPQGSPYQYSLPAQTVAYPQELIPSPSVNAQQAPERGWVGPNGGQYHPVPDPAPSNGLPSTYNAPSAVPMYAAPMPASNGGYVDPGFNSGCSSCGGGYAAGPAAGMLAPMTSSLGFGSCGAPSCSGAVYAGPIYQGPLVQPGLLARAAVPGRAFFAGGSALLLTRVDDRNVPLTYTTAMPTDNILSTRDARQYDLDGFEVFAGRYFNCGRNAFMVSYWGLFPEDRMARIDAAGAPSAYRSRYHFTGVEMPTQTVYDWYDGARSHRIIRGSEYHNLEANLLGFSVGGAARSWTSVAPRHGHFGAGGYGFGALDACGAGACGSSACGGGCGSGYASCSPCGDPCGGGGADCGSCGSGCAAFTGPCGLTPNMCGSRLNWTWLAGFRWFRFEDDLQYAASEVDLAYNSIDDLYYDVNVRNDLVGFQLGGVGTYCLGRRLNVYALTKGGVYNNHAQLSTRIYRDGGPTATINSANVYNGMNYMVESSKNQAAFLGEVGTGVGLRITRGWSANVGYRVIGAAGVATAVNNIPMEMIHLGNVADFNNTSSLFLHGWTIGGMYNF